MYVHEQGRRCLYTCAACTYMYVRRSGDGGGVGLRLLNLHRIWPLFLETPALQSLVKLRRRSEFASQFLQLIRQGRQIAWKFSKRWKKRGWDGGWSYEKEGRRIAQPTERGARYGTRQSPASGRKVGIPACIRACPYDRCFVYQKKNRASKNINDIYSFQCKTYLTIPDAHAQVVYVHVHTCTAVCMYVDNYRSFSPFSSTVVCHLFTILRQVWFTCCYARMPPIYEP